MVRIDNHFGKPPHIHVDGDKKSKPFPWVSLVKPASSFFNEFMSDLAILTMNNKTFIFQYYPQASPKRMFDHFNEALKTGKPNIQPKNVLMSNNLEVIYHCITPSRWEIFTCLVKMKLNNLTELACLLNKDYVNVWKDIQALQGLEIIKLKKEGKKIRPIALYEWIVFDLPVTPSHKTLENTQLLAK